MRKLSDKNDSIPIADLELHKCALSFRLSVLIVKTADSQPPASSKKTNIITSREWAWTSVFSFSLLQFLISPRWFFNQANLGNWSGLKENSCSNFLPVTDKFEWIVHIFLTDPELTNTGIFAFLTSWGGRLEEEVWCIQDYCWNSSSGVF